MGTESPKVRKSTRRRARFEERLWSQMPNGESLIRMSQIIRAVRDVGWVTSCPKMWAGIEECQRAWPTGRENSFWSAGRILAGRRNIEKGKKLVTPREFKIL